MHFHLQSTYELRAKNQDIIFASIHSSSGAILPRFTSTVTCPLETLLETRLKPVQRIQARGLSSPCVHAPNRVCVHSRRPHTHNFTLIISAGTDIDIHLR
jgi:hypothetical protein